MAAIGDPFDVQTSERSAEDALIVDVDGFEGPLDLLLELARRQKVDLARISILQLANQYLMFVEAARHVRLELAADYLVMAAWLAYLKSRLLLPMQKGQKDEPSAHEMAAALASRLKKLEIIRRLAAELAARHEAASLTAARGAPEATTVTVTPLYTATLYDLLSAYARQRQQNALSSVIIEQRSVISLAQARAAFERLMGAQLDWAPLDAFLTHYTATPAVRRTARASTFAVTLEMVREGHIDMQQDVAFGPLLVRRRGRSAPMAASL
jgi:segregation and condensation protein A